MLFGTHSGRLCEGLCPRVDDVASLPRSKDGIDESLIFLAPLPTRTDEGLAAPEENRPVLVSVAEDGEPASLAESGSSSNDLVRNHSRNNHSGWVRVTDL